MELDQSWTNYRRQNARQQQQQQQQQKQQQEEEEQREGADAVADNGTPSHLRSSRHTTASKTPINPSIKSPPQPPTPLPGLGNDDGVTSPTRSAAGASPTQAEVSPPIAPPQPNVRPGSRTPSSRSHKRTSADASRQKAKGSSRDPQRSATTLPSFKPSKPPSDAPPRGVLRHPGPAQTSQSQAPASIYDDTSHMIKQPETRPISQEQLVAEVKGIYAGLVMVESKCIEVDSAQSSAGNAGDGGANGGGKSAGNEQTSKSGATQASKLNNEQWQALIALHRTLLHEHHDFFLASQHPSASLALRRLAAKYAMPARMWRHGIHSFLELLRHRLPASLEHMLTFIYLAYSMMSLLLETVPAFEDTWIECLGDLGRYRMAIEDDNMVDREVWTAVSRRWYSKASDKAPATGRLYHHLAILARPNGLQQLFYYTKSLCVPIPFASARESIMTLLDPILSGQPTRLAEPDANFIFIHGVLFSGKNMPELGSKVDSFIKGLDIHIARTSRLWLEPGYYIGVANSCALAGYGDPNNVFMRAFRPPKVEEKDGSHTDEPMEGTELPPAGDVVEQALDLNCRTHRVVLRRFGDPSILPYLHVVLVFLYHVSLHSNLMGYIEKRFPWRLFAIQLNTLIAASDHTTRFTDKEFPRPAKNEAPRPLPEDYAMRGLLWSEKYLPLDWFTNTKVDDEERYFEVASMMDERRIRCLWIGCHLASSNKWLMYDTSTRQFFVQPEFEEAIDYVTTTSAHPSAEEAPATTQSATATCEAMDTDD